MPVLKAICIAFSTYSILPVPRLEWSRDNVRHSLCAFPLVGLAIGGAELLWRWLSVKLGIGPFLYASAATAIPVLLTGGIHLDGFCDTVDALSSHRDRAKKLEILADPHIGAFAAIYACVYLLLCFGLYGELSVFGISVASAGFVLSRAMSALSILTLPNARGGGMLAALTDNVERHAAWACTLAFILLPAGAMLLLSPLSGGACLALCGAWHLLYRRMAIKQFGGATGDTSGFYLQVAELLILLGCAVGGAERLVLS